MNSGNLIQSLKYGFSLQLLVRLFTFLINQIVIKKVGPSVFGLVSLKFELFHSILLSVSREAIRSVLLRVDLSRDMKRDDVHQRKEYQKKFVEMFNLALMCFVIGVVATFVFSAVLMDKFDRNYVDFYDIYRLYALSALLELLSEPVFLACQNMHLYHLRSAVEVTGLVLKCLTIYWLMFYSVDIDALSIFAYGQLVYSSSLLLGYIAVFLHLRRSVSFAKWSPRHLFSLANFNFNQVKLSISFSLQSVVKMLLSEGDKLVASLFATAQDQGVYALVANYGSLIVRMIFLPIEESFRSNAGKGKRGAFNNFYISSIRYYLYFVMVCLVFPEFVSQLFVDTVLGPNWTGASELINVYMIYVSLLGLNGISEAYLHSISDGKQVLVNTAMMTLFSTIYVAASLKLQDWNWGIQGLVYANILNSLMRIVYSNIVIFKSTQIQGVEQLLNRLKPIILFSIISKAILSIVNQSVENNKLITFSIAVLLGLLNLIIIVRQEQLLTKKEKTK